MVRTYRRRRQKRGKSRLNRLVKSTNNNLASLLEKVHLKKPSTIFFNEMGVKAVRGGRRSRRTRRTRRIRHSRKH